MRTMKRLVFAVVCAASMLVAGLARATDGTFIIGSGTYNNAASWMDGIIAGDAGSSMNIANGVYSVHVNTNVSLGNIVLAKDYVREDIALYYSGVSSRDEYDNFYSSWGLTFDSGAAVPAQFVLLPEDTKQTRMVVYTPIRLNSDFYLSYRLKTGISDNRGPCFHFFAPITENVPGRNVIIDNTCGYVPMVFSDRNTFSGSLLISNGILRVDSSTLGMGGDQGQLGLGTSIYVGTNAALNMFGYDGGQGKTLYLAGAGPGAASSYGAFGSSCGLPNHTSVWHGAVVLTGNTKIGAAMGGGTWYMARQGTVAINGPISEQGGSFSLEKVRSNFLYLNSANAYSGGTILSDGVLCVTNANALGTGPLLFNNGRLLFASDVDLGQTALITTNSRAMNVEISEGVTVTQRVLAAGSNVKDGLNRFGRGTFVLSANGTFASTASMQSYWYDGVTVADYSQYLSNKLPTGGAFRMAGGTFLFKNDPINLPGSFTQSTGGIYLESGKASVVSNLTHVGEILVNFGSTLGRSVGSTLMLGGEEGTIQLNKACINGIYPDACITYGPYTWACVSNAYAVGYKDYSTDWTANTNVDITADCSAPDATTVNSLRFNTAADVTVDQAGSLNLVSGGILVTPNVGSNTVTIQGGTITSGNAVKDVVIHQHNSQGSLVLKSGITSNGTAQVILTKTGDGTLVLDSTNMASASSMYISGGMLEVRRLSDFNFTPEIPKTNTTMTVYLNGGGIRLAGEADLRVLTANVRQNVTISVGPQGGVIDVPEGKTVSMNSWSGTSALLGMGGPLVKRGKGTLVFENGFSCGREDYPFTIEEGAVKVVSYLSNQPMRVIAKPGTTLISGFWLWGRGWGRADMCDAMCLEIQKGDQPVTVDLNGVSGSIGGLWAYTPNHDFLEGNGDLVITNSSVTAAYYYPYSSIHRKFTGTITLTPNVWGTSNSGIGIPNGTLVIPEGVTANFGGLSATLVCGVGALTGNGALLSVTEYPRTICVGDDRAEPFEFSGFLKGYFGGAGWLESPTNGVRFVKTGTCSWRVSGATNVLNHQTVVRKGTLLAGNNSNGTGPGAFGKGAILLGDDKSDANSSLAFLTDGAFTIGNTFAQGTLDTSVTLTVGGNSPTDASYFTSDLLLSRTLCLHSAGGDVTFSGAVSGPGGITKTGAGTVYLTGAVGNAGPTAVQAGLLVLPGGTAVTNAVTVTAGTAGSGILTVSGNLTLGPGATLAVTTSGSLVRGQTYTLMTWTGARSGTFATVTGLPADWHVGYLADSLVLYYARPGILIRVL